MKDLNKKSGSQESRYNAYFAKAQNATSKIPNVKGMPAMDAVSLLENMGLKVKLKGNVVGKVKSQSVSSGQPLQRNAMIELVVI